MRRENYLLLWSPEMTSKHGWPKNARCVFDPPCDFIFVITYLRILIVLSKWCCFKIVVIFVTFCYYLYPEFCCWLVCCRSGRLTFCLRIDEVLSHGTVEVWMCDQSIRLTYIQYKMGYIYYFFYYAYLKKSGNIDYEITYYYYWDEMLKMLVLKVLSTS